MLRLHDHTAAQAADARAMPGHNPSIAVFGGLVLLYTGLGSVLLPLYRHQLNPDGVSYLAIARHYWNADWGEVVNGVWSPMYSWLLAPPVGLGADPLLAAHALNLAAGLLALGGTWVLAGRYTRVPWLRTAAAAALLPVLLAWSFSLVTPDLLLVAVLLWYLVALTSPRYDIGMRHAALAGALGGVAYLAKGYALPFVLIHFGGWHIWHAWHAVDSGVRRAWLRRLAVGLMCCTAIASPWVVLVSLKYGHLTQSTAMDYNWRLIGPRQAGVHPTYLPGLLDPTGPHATSAWEDPSVLATPDWSALNEPVYFARVLAGNLAATVTILQRFSPLAVPLAVTTVLATRTRREPLTAGQRRLLGLTGYTIPVLMAGYTMVRVGPATSG